MLSEAPPFLENLKIFLTNAESVEVNTFTSSGMRAPAIVPQVMMEASFHHSVPPPRSGMSTNDVRYVRPMERNEVIHTSEVSGDSKFIFFACPKRSMA